MVRKIRSAVCVIDFNYLFRSDNSSKSLESSTNALIDGEIPRGGEVMVILSYDTNFSLTDYISFRYLFLLLKLSSYIDWFGPKKGAGAKITWFRLSTPNLQPNIGGTFGLKHLSGFLTYSFSLVGLYFKSWPSMGYNTVNISWIESSSNIEANIDFFSSFQSDSP